MLKNLHNRIISLRGEIWAYKTSKTSPLFIELLVSSQESERLMNPINNRNKEYNTTAIKDPEILGIITIFLNIKSTYIYIAMITLQFLINHKLNLCSISAVIVFFRSVHDPIFIYMH
jgi:hypothetical protein